MAGGCVTLALAAPAGAGKPAPLKPPAWLHPLIETIRAAATPEEARDAYARAAVVDAGSLDLKAAYVARMVALRKGERVFAEAQELAIARPDHWPSLAVAAHMYVRTGRLALALPLGIRAAEIAPTEAFVARTVGDLLRRTHRDRSWRTIPAPLRRRIRAVRKALAGGAHFAAACAPRPARAKPAPKPATGTRRRRQQVIALRAKRRGS